MTAPFKRRKVDTSRIITAARESLTPRMETTVVYEVEGVYEVPIARIRPNPLNSRAYYPSSAEKTLVKSMADDGQLVAACGFLDLAGDVVLIEGHRRLHAREKLGFDTLRVEIRPLPESEQALYKASRNANVERESQTPLDDAVVWLRLIQRGTFKNRADLARSLGLAESHVSRTIALAEIPQSIIQALLDYPACMTLRMLNAIRELSELQSEEKTLIYVIEVTRAGLGYREVEARRKSLESGPKTRCKAVSRELTFHGAKGLLKTFEKEGRLELSLKGLSPEYTEEILKKLEAVFAASATA